jgi:N-acetylmuramoyl-L-alanine amidase
VGVKGNREADINLNIAKETVVQLECLGISGELTRAGDDSVSLSRRVELSEGKDLFVSIHCNHFTDYRVHGVETLFPSPGGKSKSLANYIHQAIVGGHRDRGIKMSPSKAYPQALYVLRMAKIPSCLVESEFLSNPTQEEWLANTATQAQLGYNIAKGIASWIKNQGGVLPEPEPKIKKRRKRKSQKIGF